MSCLIEMEHVSYCYPEGLNALIDISLHVSHGEHVGLVGPNGAGKTTLFLLLSGIIDSFEGSTCVAGCDLSAHEGRREVHSKLGIVFQNTDDQLFNASVFEDIAFGPLNMGLNQEEIQRRVAQALAQVGLESDFLERLPFHLSGGEKRRVAIAGVLAMTPKVLLLDEPSSDLDPRGQRELIAILKDLKITRIISSHNLEFILETSERVIVFDNGKIVADGETREVFSNQDLMLEHGLEVPFRLR